MTHQVQQRVGLVQLLGAHERVIHETLFRYLKDCRRDLSAVRSIMPQHDLSDSYSAIYTCELSIPTRILTSFEVLVHSITISPSRSTAQDITYMLTMQSTNKTIQRQHASHTVSRLVSQGISGPTCLHPSTSCIYSHSQPVTPATRRNISQWEEFLSCFVMPLSRTNHRRSGYWHYLRLAQNAWHVYAGLASVSSELCNRPFMCRKSSVLWT